LQSEEVKMDVSESSNLEQITEKDKEDEKQNNFQKDEEKMEISEGTNFEQEDERKTNKVKRRSERRDF